MTGTGIVIDLWRRAAFDAMKPADMDATIALLLAVRVHAAVIINEIQYAAAAAPGSEEFIELYNAGAAAVDLSGWSFTKGVSYTFPAGTSLEAGAYLVVAGQPDALKARHDQLHVFGPFQGRLRNEGERLELRDRDGKIADEVDFRPRFPWPYIDGSTSASIELIHPRLDNHLGGSWRAAGSPTQAAGFAVAEGSPWRYWKGTSPPSSPPSTWRRPGFDDAGWLRGTAPIGYGDGHVTTVLGDMRGRYTSVYLRRTFDVRAVGAYRDLALEVRYDDGFNAWINGVHVAGVNAPSADAPHSALALGTREAADFEAFPLPQPERYLKPGENVLALQLLNASLGSSSDAWIDARLRYAQFTETPGRRNSIWSEEPPIHLGGVRHAPFAPPPRTPVTVSIRATSPAGITSVTLEYQLVDPGAYFGVGDKEFDAGWSSLPMNDDGFRGDTKAGDGVYSAVLPAPLQQHRRLVRYRFKVGSGSGATLAAPPAEDPQPNFAYFVYDRVPTWKGAIEPGSRAPERARVVAYGADVLAQVPVYHLITRRTSTEDATWRRKYGGNEYRWRGTLVYDGRVYDHIGYRARGGVWRYAMGKNMWKFDFHRGHRFRARDNWGRRYRTRWDKLNLSAVIQQGDTGMRGEQGLFESTGFRLFNLAGVPAPKTHFVHLRIIDDAGETGPTQYDGDFWGLYLAIEQMDGRFLDEHGLPDGNLYKMEGGWGELNNRGFAAPVDGSDLSAFISAYRRSARSDAWWRQNFDLEGYYSFRAIVEAIHHYEIGAGKNYFYYHNPDSGRWSVLPWDIDLTWADHMFGSGVDPFYRHVLTRPAFQVEYQNRVREIRDLLFNAEKVPRLIDEYAALISDPEGGPSIVDADRARWDHHPVMSDRSLVLRGKTRPGLFYSGAPGGDFEGMVRLMKEYSGHRGRRLDRIAHDAAIPDRPRLEYTGPPGFPASAITCRASPFSDPQGDDTFGAMEWRLADVTPPGTPPFRPDRAWPSEIEAVWETDLRGAFEPELTLPAEVLVPGRRYRLRVRTLDDTGRASHWSAPLELEVGEER